MGNRTNRGIEIRVLTQLTNGPPVSDRLSVASWNIGYGGLGAESDFLADGGDHLLPPSRAVVEKNVSGIARELEHLSADAILLQEVAGPSLLTRGVDTLGAVTTTLIKRDNAFSPDFVIRHLVYPFAAEHGLLTSLGFAGATREVVALPLEPGYMMGITKRLYHLHVVRSPFPGGEWTIINLHLSAFDDSAETRAAQLSAVFDFAEREFAAGRYVVIGGDWNLEFFRPDRPFTTTDDDLFWIHAFPDEYLPQGWQIAIDRETPSVRTNERPYRYGENYTTVIDGFVVSPNVITEMVETRDTDFKFTDHQLVTAVFRAGAD